MADPERPTNKLRLAELAVPGQVNLRGDPADSDFLRLAGAALDCLPPVNANTAQSAADLTVLWLGPDEWLVVAPPGGEAALVAKLRRALDGVHAAVTDVTGNRARLSLSGLGAREVLMKGCSLDLHPRVFTPGQCAQTILGRAQVILHQIGEAPAYDIYPQRSFAPYVWMWLCDAMAEFGGQPATLETAAHGGEIN